MGKKVARLKRPGLLKHSERREDWVVPGQFVHCGGDGIGRQRRVAAG